MKLKDFVVNSLPRVRGKKKTRPVAVIPTPATTSTTYACRYDNPPPPPVRVSSMSRDCSVERASHVAVADANWRQSPPRMAQAEVGLMGHMPYYSPPPPGMVLSHSAEGISTQSLAVLTSRSQKYDYGASPYSPISAYSETAVNYPMATSAVVFQSQHHHRHSHQHDYHYVYHHHHHHKLAPESSSNRVPLMDSNQLNQPTRAKTSALTPTSSGPRKSEPGFLKKSFASFRAMRKPRNSTKDAGSAVQVKCGDENGGKCLVCPYPQRHAVAMDDVKKLSDTRPSKPKRKGFKSLRKSKGVPANEPMDKSWYSDNDASSSVMGHHHSDHDLFLHATTQRPRIRECSVESCMSRLDSSQDRYCVTEPDYSIGPDSHSLSGYESDLPRSTGRTRTRIKTNPWLPSPQPSLNMGRRFERGDFRESREDVMTVDDDYCPSIARSASFDYQCPAILSSFKSTSSKGRPVQRHRSLTPTDLKVTLAITKSPSNAQSTDTELSQHSPQIENKKQSLNDLSLPAAKSRPTSILSPTSEFVILADNIEQLANNISFEYEDMLDTTLERVPACQEDGKHSIQELLADEELPGSHRSDENIFSNNNQAICNAAHSPDSGIGCLGSSDGDDLTQGAAQSSSSSLSPVHPRQNGDISSSASSIVAALPNINFESLSPSSNDGSNSQLYDSTCPSGFLPDTPISSRMVSGTAEKSPIGDLDERMSDVCSSAFDCTQCHGHNELIQGQHNYVPADDSFSSVEEDMRKLDSIRPPSPHQAMSCILRDQFNTFSPPKTSVSNSSGFNDFRDDSSLKSPLQTWKNDSLQLPPNIIRSEMATPLGSPTENWRFDGAPFPNVYSDATQYVFPAELAARGMRNDEACSYCEEQERNDGTSCSSFSKDVAGKPVTRDVDDATENTTSLDLADASVQTDFNDEDTNSWQNASRSNLDSLCDDEFDAIESTRRWLLTGNMQGSADTGYSSQPRNSQILMDEEDSTASDNHQDIKMNPAGNLNSVNIDNQSASGIHPKRGDTINKVENEIKVSEKGDIIGSPKDQQVLKSCHGKQAKQSDELVHDMFSGIESQFKDIFHQLWSPHGLPETTGNKRDSSGSSTSTLISEPLGNAAISVLMSEQKPRLDQLTPRHLNCDNGNLNIARTLDEPQSSSGKKLPKKKKTSSKEEPDYVNIPRKSRSGKSSTSQARTTTEQKIKDHSVSFKKCSVRSYPQSGENLEMCSDSYPSNTTSSLWNTNACAQNAESADYLAFLKDAPLSNVHMTRSMFLIPGFGPIDMSSSTSLNRVTSADSYQPVSTNQCQKSQSFKTRSKPSSQVTVHRVKSLISEGRQSTRSKLTPEKEAHDAPAFASQSVSKVYNASGQHHPPSVGPKVTPSKPKRKNPRGSQTKTCPTRPLVPTSSHPSADYSLGQGRGFNSNALAATKGKPHQTLSYPDSAIRNLAERISQLQREKDVIYMQLREVQQDELSRQRQQLQHHRNIHSQRKEVLLQTLRELKVNLEEQSRKLNIATNRDVYI